MTIDELKQFCDTEFKNIEKVIDELVSIYMPEKSDYTLADRAAIASFIVNVYSGIEVILKQMLLFDKLNIEDSPDWHEKVLRKAGEIGILPPELIQVLSKYLAFRNYFIYSYIFNIKWEDLKALADILQDVKTKVQSEVKEYLQTIG